MYDESLRKIIDCHDSPNYYITWTLNLETILSLCQSWQETLTYGWDLKVVIYPYGLGHYWWRLVIIGVFNRDTMISYRFETIHPLGWSIGTCDLKDYDYNISFSRNLTYAL